MGDENFDHCEYFYYQVQVQQLLAYLQQTQSHCSDNECFSLSRLPGPSGTTPQVDSYLMLVMVIGFLMLLYVLRPRSMRRMRTSTKISEITSSNDNPPGAPPASN